MRSLAKPAAPGRGAWALAADGASPAVSRDGLHSGVAEPERPAAAYARAARMVAATAAEQRALAAELRQDWTDLRCRARRLRDERCGERAAISGLARQLLDLTARLAESPAADHPRVAVLRQGPVAHDVREPVPPAASAPRAA